MGKLYVFNMVSLDGYFAGPKGELDWHNVDAEFNAFAIKQLKATETIVFGRITYDMLANYWPTQVAVKDDPIVAELMNSLPKVVVAPKLKQPAWNNTRLINKDLTQEITKLKHDATADIAIFGSSILSISLLQLNLIDELRIMVNPVVLGKGRSLFAGLHKPISLKLQKTKVFKSGNVLLTYTTIK